MPAVKNIIFDLGNVIIDIDIPATYAALGSLYDMSKGLPEDRVFKDYETGKLSNEAFINKLQRHAKPDTHAQPIIDAWNAMLQTIPQKRFQLLDKLRQNYKLYILSNTNDLHLQWVYNYLAQVHDIRDFDKRFFTKTYYSHQVGMRKPNRDIYEHVLRDAGIQARESMFIDDTKENLLQSAALGIRSVHLPKGMEIAEVLPALL